jgi:DNA-binding XRE family transcriptional regulator
MRLTQVGLANKLGIERRSILRFEKGEPLPTVSRLAIIQLLVVYTRKRRRLEALARAESTKWL